MQAADTSRQAISGGSRREWTDEEVATLHASYSSGGVAQIAIQLFRSISSVHCKAFKLGLKKQHATEYKTCPRCNIDKLRKQEFYERSNGSQGMRTESYCKACCREIAKLNPQPSEKRRQQYHKHGEKRRFEMREKGKVESQNLLPTYLAKALRMSCRDVPPDLLSMKRDQLAMRRLARLIKKAIHENQQNG